MSRSLPLRQRARAAAANGVDSRERERIWRNVLLSLIVFTTGLFAMFSGQPKVAMLFIAAYVSFVAAYFMDIPMDVGNTHHIAAAFLSWLPKIYTAAGCILVVLGISQVTGGMSVPTLFVLFTVSLGFPYLTVGMSIPALVIALCVILVFISFIS